MRDHNRREDSCSGAGSLDLKHSAGGMTEIEFMVEYAVLRWARDHPPPPTWTANIRLLETIVDFGRMSVAACRCLYDAGFTHRVDFLRCAW